MENAGMQHSAGMQHAVLPAAGVGAEVNQDSGEHLLGEIFDLICQRLPRLPLDDPARPALAVLSPMLAEALGRPRVAEVLAAQRPA